MKRTGWLKRRTPLRSGGRIRSRATRRMGKSDLANMQADDLARACVMVRDGATYAVDPKRLVLLWFGRCVDCGQERGLEWSHVYGRGEAPTLSWLPLNAIAQCKSCHYRHTNNVDKRGNMERIVGAERMEQLAAIRLEHKAGKYDHAAQFDSNHAWLAEHGAWALRDLRSLWAQREERADTRRAR